MGQGPRTFLRQQKVVFQSAPTNSLDVHSWFYGEDHARLEAELSDFHPEFLPLVGRPFPWIGLSDRWEFVDVETEPVTE